MSGMTQLSDVSDLGLGPADLTVNSVPTSLKLHQVVSGLPVPFFSEDLNFQDGWGNEKRIK